MSLVESMQWRYATKKFDPSVKLADSEFEDLLECVRLAPTSFGLQPFKVFVVQDPALRKLIRTQATPNVSGFEKVEEASHLVVFAAQTHVDEKTVRQFVDLTCEVRGVPRDSMREREQQIVGAVSRLASADRTHWAQKQVYLALGIFIAAAAQAGIDACPMEGFLPAKVDELLDLSGMGLTATALAVVGKRSADDSFARLAKVRKDLDALIHTV